MTARGPQVTAVQDDVVDVLQGQHQRIRDGFDRLGAASGVEKRELFEGLIRLLAVHEVAEEELVHPLARRKIGSGQQVVDERLREEQQIKTSLAELYDLGTDHPDFNGRLARLREAVAAHAEHEEQHELPHLRQTVDANNLQRLASLVLTVERRAAPTRPHPGVPASAAVNVLIGPPLSVFDRMRDALRDVRERIAELR
jgi:Hemerythrin HHE cation binding domain